MLKSELDTPSLILDLDLFESNLIRMRNIAVTAGKKLRPHAKTHKCPEIAKRQLAAGNCAGICAAKLSEAEGLADAGIQDILITSPVSASWKIARLPALNRKISGLMLVADNPEQVKLLAETAAKENMIFQVLVDVDPEMGRTGVPFESAADFGAMIASYPSLKLAGVQCYAGHLQHIPNFSDRKKEDLRLMKKGAEVFRLLKERFFSCTVFTGTGTGTMPADLKIPELTDMQVGSYCLMDSEYLGVEHGLGAFEPALKMRTSVISANHPGFVTIDAGTKALYVTPGAPPKVFRNGQLQTDCLYDWSFGDEHGRLTLPPGVRLVPGNTIEMTVSHCDPTVNLFDEIFACRGNTVVERFPISLRGCCR